MNLEARMGGGESDVFFFYLFKLNYGLYAVKSKDLEFNEFGQMMIQ